MRRNLSRDEEVQALAAEYQDLGYPTGLALQLAQASVDDLLVEAAGYSVEVELKKARKKRGDDDNQRERGT